MEMLRIAAALVPRIFICVDALDKHLLDHLPELLGDIVRESPTTRISLTKMLDVMEHIQIYFTKTVVIPVNPNMDDIRNCLEKGYTGIPSHRG